MALGISRRSRDSGGNDGEDGCIQQELFCVCSLSLWVALHGGVAWGWALGFRLKTITAILPHTGSDDCTEDKVRC